jgi:tetratricopeptide (TPR) repeat protein
MKFGRRVAATWVAAALLGGVAAPSQDLTQQSRRAKELMAEGRFSEAVPIYRQLVRALPNNPGLLTNLGLALDMAGHKREAVREYQAALKLSPHDYPALLFLGTAYLDLGKPAEALPPIARALEAEPESLDAQEAMAEALLGLGRLEDAVHRFERLAQADPSSPRVWYGLGLGYDGLAQKNFDQLAAAAPGSAYWLRLVADSRLERKQYYAAFYFYRQALARMPSMRGVHAALAEIYRRTGHSDWAAVEEQKERRLPAPDCRLEPLECAFQKGNWASILKPAEPGNAAACYWKTRAYTQLALNAYRRLGELPPSMEAYQLRAKIDSARRQYAQSAEDWRRALQLSPNNPYVEKELAVALYQTGDLKTAQKLFAQLLASEPTAPDLNFYFGQTLLSSQHPADAIPYLERAAQRDPGWLPAERSLGLAYLEMGDAEKSIPHLERALSLDEDGSLHYQLARAYQARGNRERASALIRQYRQMQEAQQAANQTVEKTVTITPPDAGP